MIVVYIVLMQRADRRLQRAFEADSQRDAASAPAADSTRDANDEVNAGTDAPAARGR
ncbi:hypothetical protein QFZ91_001994 [Paraburkholderia sp. JPY419]